MKNIKENIKLARYTTYKIGGPARYFYIAKNEDQITGAVSWARKQRMPYFILGGGSNILISDKGFDGLVVKIENNNIILSKGGSDPQKGVRPLQLQATNIEAEAGIDLPKLVQLTIDNGLKGLEWASGIPGTFGGAIRGNAGAFGGEIKDIITSVRFLDERGNIKTINNDACNFSYRDSIFKQSPNYIILSAALRLKKGKRQELKKFSEDTIAYRASHHPLEYGSCGSVFKAIDVNNLRLNNFEKYPALKDAMKNNPYSVIPTACFIDEADLKGYRIGGAMVSDKHPNFLVNYNNAKADDILMLISFVKQRLINIFGVIPEEEVQYVGW